MVKFQIKNRNPTKSDDEKRDWWGRKAEKPEVGQTFNQCMLVSLA